MVIATLVTVLALYFSVGHATHASMAAAMGSATHGIGICLLVAALLAPFAIARPAGVPVLCPVLSLIPAATRLPSAVPSRARASPAWLQRFLR